MLEEISEPIKQGSGFRPDLLASPPNDMGLFSELLVGHTLPESTSDERFERIAQKGVTDAVIETCGLAPRPPSNVNGIVVVNPKG